MAQIRYKLSTPHNRVSIMLKLLIMSLSQRTKMAKVLKKMPKMLMMQPMTPSVQKLKESYQGKSSGLTTGQSNGSGLAILNSFLC